MWMELNQEIQEVPESKKELEQLKQECLQLAADVPNWDMMEQL
jgi:hypothetical protein